MLRCPAAVPAAGGPPPNMHRPAAGPGRPVGRLLWPDPSRGSGRRESDDRRTRTRAQVRTTQHTARRAHPAPRRQRLPIWQTRRMPRQDPRPARRRRDPTRRRRSCFRCPVRQPTCCRRRCGSSARAPSSPRMASEGPTDRRGCRQRAAVSRPALGDALRRYRWLYQSALHVCELLAHLAIADLEQVDAADVSTVPAVRPTLDDAIAERERLLDLESARGVVEDRPPGLAAFVATLVLPS